ncbi:MAG: hypothetical protein AAGH89_15365 [Verrucomicrobiota bacterium]
MQSSHRRFHRLLWLIVSAIAALALIYATMNRPTPATNESLPQPPSQTNS